MALDSIPVVDLQALQVCPQETLVASIWQMRVQRGTIRSDPNTCLADEVVSFNNRLPDRESSLDLMSILLLPWRQQVTPHPQVCLHPPLDVLDQPVDPDGGPAWMLETYFFKDFFNLVYLNDLGANTV